MTNNTLINNGINGLALTNDVYGSTLNTDATWNITDTTYFIRDDITIGTDKTLTVTPGVIVKFDIGQVSVSSMATTVPFAYWDTDCNPSHFHLLSATTPSAGIPTTTARLPTARVVTGVVLSSADNSNDATSLIDHAVIRYGGVRSAAVPYLRGYHSVQCLAHYPEHHSSAIAATMPIARL